MRGLAPQISSTLTMPRAVSRIAWMRIGRVRPALASSWASSRSTYWMSSAPCTFGTMTTSSLSPIAGTSVVMSSRNQGESSALTRVHSWVVAPSPPRPSVL